MKLNNQSGYILFLNLILITLIALFIPLLIQEQRINYRILNNRIRASQNKAAVESGLQYQLYILKNNNSLCDGKIILYNKTELRIEGKEGVLSYNLYSHLDELVPYTAEMKVNKSDFKIINKKIYRSE